MISHALAFVVLLSIASSFVNAQDILFPGATDRPDRFPLKTTRFPNNPTNRPTNRPTNPTNFPTNPTNFPTNPTNFPTNPTNFPTNPTVNDGLTTSSAAPNPAVTTQSPGQQTTPDIQAYNRCVSSCLTTSEYNPVCGSDGAVYSNPGRLNCARNCGNPVTLVKTGQCTDNVRG